ncbi:ABC-type Mn2+/Zn2+ transport system ATPase subunit [Pseudomonas sp. PvP027]|nr:ABC-type Mn2+/Zn2+ transport system ATPase subunit [Pseudomonas sp. PvP027]
MRSYNDFSATVNGNGKPTFVKSVAGMDRKNGSVLITRLE